MTTKDDLVWRQVTEDMIEAELPSGKVLAIYHGKGLTETGPWPIEVSLLDPMRDYDPVCPSVEVPADQIQEAKKVALDMAMLYEQKHRELIIPGGWKVGDRCYYSPPQQVSLLPRAIGQIVAYDKDKRLLSIKDEATGKIIEQEHVNRLGGISWVGQGTTMTAETDAAPAPTPQWWADTAVDCHIIHQKISSLRWNINVDRTTRFGRLQTALLQAETAMNQAVAVAEESNAKTTPLPSANRCC